MTNKLSSIQSWLEEQQLDVAYFSDFHSIDYLTGFNSDPIERVLALVVFPQDEPFIFAPALEVEAVKSAGWTHPVYGYQDQENPWDLISQHLHAHTQHTEKWAVEQEQLTLKRASLIQTAIPEAKFIGNLSPLMTKLHLIKTPDEIVKLHKAGEDADRAFEFAFKALQAGVSELQVMAKLEYDLKSSGVVGMSFDTLVQFGAHAAEPHGDTSNNTLKSGDLALFDLGTIYDGYVSDATRTVAFQSVSDHQREVYDVVLEAELTAQAAAKPGMTAGELDGIARDIITKAGYGEYFVHRLGHGIGSSVHESIQIAQGNDLVLQPGMSFSIEPGIYIPGDLGIRIEDSVIVTESGVDPYTHSPKELRIIE